MIEVYSKNITVAENSAIPFNNVYLKKGNYEELSGVASIQFNHCGVYHFVAYGSITGTGDLVLQVMKNGVVLPQTVLPITGTADADIPFMIDTYIQVPNNNVKCCCQAPTQVEIVNAGVEATFSLIDVKTEKVC